MKKVTMVVLAMTLIVSFSFSFNAEAKSVKVYKNCTELNKDYKGGVAISATTKNKGGKTKYKPHVSKELYEANKKSDRDKDGIACER